MSRFLEKLSGTKTFYGWNSGKCFGFAEAAVEVMLSGWRYRGHIGRSVLYWIALYVFFKFTEAGVFGMTLSKEGGRKK